jgi:serine/threonine protein kinase
VAIKQILKSKLKPKQLEALKKEITIMSSLVCDNITKIYDVKQSAKHYYLVLEYCKGGDLDKVRGKRLEEPVVQQVTHQIAKALKVLIGASVMHRDLKLSNLLLSDKRPNPVVKLADFGLARELHGDEYAKTYCGTPLYMAPEILAGNRYDLKSDLWSIGVIIYLFATGRFPFEAATPHQLLIVLTQGIVKFPPGLAISECCTNLIRQLLKVKPEERMEWKDFFEHPFIKTLPEEYKKGNVPKVPSPSPGPGIPAFQLASSCPCARSGGCSDSEGGVKRCAAGRRDERNGRTQPQRVFEDRPKQQ